MWEDTTYAVEVKGKKYFEHILEKVWDIFIMAQYPLRAFS